MSNNNITKAFKLAKATNKIILDAQINILKGSFQTAKDIASLYRKAGGKFYRVGKKAVKESLDLAIENQKDIFETSGQAIKDAKQTITTSDLLTKKKKSKKKKDLKIDDLL